MNKSIILFITVIVFLLVCTGALGVKPLLKSEPANYCHDPESWNEWNQIITKYPDDDEVQTLHALRLGFCAKIGHGSIELKRAIKLFDQAHETVIRKRFYEPKENDKKL